jgi:hypothetical protein
MARTVQNTSVLKLNNTISSRTSTSAVAFDVKVLELTVHNHAIRPRKNVHL